MKASKKGHITLLAIETSCDETAAAVLTGSMSSARPTFEIKSSVVKTQIQIHKKTGGVVPEVAAREHMKNISPVTQKALTDAGITLDTLDYIAVTSGPGLIVSLVVGTEFAKGISLARNIFMIPTNHMAGHMYSAFAESTQKVKFPVLSIIVSGGHTMLVIMHSYAEYEIIGETVDDAVGEAFDKVARLLELPYPGGPEIDKIAREGKTDIKFPRPMINEPNYKFSFSGLKTAVLYHIDKLKKPLTRSQKADIAMSFENAAVDVLVTKAVKACREYKCKTISLGGGVAANIKLREALRQAAITNKMEFVMPDFSLCTDNAKMIAIAAYFKVRNGFKPVKATRVKADPTWELETTSK